LLCNSKPYLDSSLGEFSEWKNHILLQCVPDLDNEISLHLWSSKPQKQGPLTNGLSKTLVHTTYINWNSILFLEYIIVHSIWRVLFAWYFLPNCSWKSCLIVVYLRLLKLFLCFLSLEFDPSWALCSKPYFIIMSLPEKEHIFLYCFASLALSVSLDLHWFGPTLCFSAPSATIPHLFFLLSIYKIRLWTTSKYLLSYLLQVLSMIPLLNSLLSVVIVFLVHVYWVCTFLYRYDILWNHTSAKVFLIVYK